MKHEDLTRRIIAAAMKVHLVRPDRFPRGARPSESPSPHATRSITALMKPVRSR